MIDVGAKSRKQITLSAAAALGSDLLQPPGSVEAATPGTVTYTYTYDSLGASRMTPTLAVTQAPIPMTTQAILLQLH